MKREGFKKVVSILTICILILSQGICGFAAADPKENIEIQNLTEGWLDSYSQGGIIDTNDTSHGKVKWFSYDPTARMAAEKVWAAEKAKANVDKHISFDLYIYDNTIPYEIRFCDGEKKAGKVLGQININFLGTAEDKPMTIVNSNAKISIGNKTYAEETVLELENQKWHKVEVIFSEGRSTYYINGQNIGSSTHDGTYFTSYQIVARKGNYAKSVTEKSGIYLDNFKSVVYGDVAQFYGKASVTGSNINVEFSESVSSTFTAGFSGVKVYNTKTEAVVATGTPTLSGTTLTIPVNETLATATEYMIDFPNKPIGISGKKLYSNVYFYVAGVNSAKESSENFDAFSTLSNNTTNKTADIIAANTGWFSEKKINIKDLTSETDTVDKAHNKVIYGKDSSKTNDNIRWGIKTSKTIDTTKGEASVEFDIKILSNKYKRFIIQPYSTTASGDADTTLVNAGSYDGGTNSMNSTKNQFCSFAITGNHADGSDSKLIFNPADSNIYTGEENSTPEGVVKVPFAKNNWHTIKITIDNTKSEKNDTVIKLYVDGTHKSTNTAAINGVDITNILRGVRFAMVASGADKEAFWIDNVKFTYFEDEEVVVEKVRIYDLKDENYGPMATDVPSSAECAKIKLTKAIASAADAVVSVSDGVNTITSDVTLSNDGTILTAIFDDMLQGNTEYTLTVLGTGFTGSTAKFTTSESNELVIYNLRITDGSGNALSGKPTTTGTYHVKAKVINATDSSQHALILGAVYNDNCMKDVNFKEVTVGARSKSDEISFPITVGSCENLSLSAMAWENFATCKPILEAVEY